MIFLSAGLKKKAYCVRCVRTPVLFFLRSYGDTCIICIHLCIGASIEDTYISYVTPAAVRRLRVIREENKGPDRHGGKIEKPLQKSNADDKKKRKKHIIIKEKDMKEKKNKYIYTVYI